MSDWVRQGGPGQRVGPSSADLGWLVAAAGIGAGAGMALPFLLEGGLELYAVLITSVIVIGLLCMPQRRTFRDATCWGIFLVFVTLYASYPHYISLQISGLPWISPIRIVMAALFFVWLYALRMSAEMQANIRRHVKTNQLFMALLATYVAAQFLSVPTSQNVSQSLTKLFFYQLYWTFPFFVVLSLVRDERRLALFVPLFIALGAFQCAIGFIEARQTRIVWLDFIPPGFGADSELLTRIMQGTFRFNDYRVQGSFTVSLVYAEFLVMMLPFALFAALDGRTMRMKLAGLVTVVAILPAQFLSGSRLGMVGTIVVFLAAGAAYVIRQKHVNPRSMAGLFLVLMLPFGLAAFGVAYVSSPRLQAMTIGGHQHEASTDARREQVRMAIPKVAARPLFGYGVGVSGEALGYRNLAGIITVDSYLVTLVMEVGLVGFLAYIAMIIIAIWQGFAIYLRAREGPATLAGPIATSLLAFLVVKFVLSQSDTHMITFIMMALMLVVSGLERAAAKRPESAVFESVSRGRKPGRRQAPAIAAGRHLHQRSRATSVQTDDRSTPKLTISRRHQAIQPGSGSL